MQPVLLQPRRSRLKASTANNYGALLNAFAERASNVNASESDSDFCTKFSHQILYNF